MPEGKVFTNHIQTKWMCYNYFVLWCVSGSKAPLLVSGTKENGFILLSILLVLSQNVVSSVADGKSWISMPLCQNGFTMLAHITFLVFGLSLNVHLMLLYQPIGYLHYTQSIHFAWLIIHVQVRNTHLLGKVGA